MVHLAAEQDALSGLAEIEGRSLWQDARRRLLHNKAALTGQLGT